MPDYPDTPVGEVDPHDHEADPDLGVEGYTGEDLDEKIGEVEPPDEKLDTDWVDPVDLTPNDWNPNYMPEHRKDLLVLSLLDNGWTQPIVARPDDNVIIDGEHRWRLATDDRISDRDDLTPEGVPAGHVPVHWIDAERKQAMIATYQQNYSTGSDDPDKLADLVGSLDDSRRDFAADRMGVTRNELEMLLPDDDLVDDATELWDTPWEDDTDMGEFTERLELRMLESEAELVRDLFGDAGTASGLVKLCRFIVKTELYEDVDDAPEPEWSKVPAEGDFDE